jgi:hypothetical protein
MRIAFSSLDNYMVYSPLGLPPWRHHYAQDHQTIFVVFRNIDLKIIFRKVGIFLFLCFPFAMRCPLVDKFHLSTLNPFRPYLVGFFLWLSWLISHKPNQTTNATIWLVCTTLGCWLHPGLVSVPSWRTENLVSVPSWIRLSGAWCTGKGGNWIQFPFRFRFRSAAKGEDFCILVWPLSNRDDIEKICSGIELIEELFGGTVH